MKEDPIVLTELALQRILKEFAVALGLSPVMSDTTSQVQVQVTDLPRRWSEFLLRNCSRCKSQPSSCEIFNPPPGSTGAGTTPAQLRSAYCTMVETGRLTPCPLLEPAEAGGDDTP